MYITNNPITAKIAQQAGVDRIWIDMEYLGKEDRQGNLDTVKNHHTIEDIKNIRPVVDKAELLVRVNPIHDANKDICSSEEEINSAIEAGADVVMLPMFKTADEVKRFISAVDRRAKVQLLFETPEAVENIDEILNIPGVDEIHIGLNDLHLALGMKFMFELLCGDTVKYICSKARNKGIKYGFGGIARIGYGMLPAEYVIAEHYHLGSTAAILSRSFCDANSVQDPMKVKDIFIEGVKNIRNKEIEISNYTEEQFEENIENIRRIVSQILKDKTK